MISRGRSPLREKDIRTGAEQERKAAWHDTGTRNMPAREFLRIYERTAYFNDLSDLAARLLVRQLEASLRTPTP
jgi:hypothetical protein